jgi:alkylation response protein AidB-like acyl-CoA dehydrogenase
MRLSPTSEQQEIKDAVRRFAAERVTAERLAAWQESPHGIDDDTWGQIAALGWLALGLPAELGGSGLGLIEVACVAEECGRGLLPLPITNALRATMALAALDPHAPELRALGSGERMLALALDERDACAPEALATCIDNGAVGGEKWYVSDAGRAELHLVAAREGDGISLVLVDAATARCTALRSFDGDRQWRVTYDRSPVGRRLNQPRAGADRVATLRRVQTALALAEMVGGMDAVLAMTVEYVKQREQFGQKLAVFQAVQHQVADMATDYTAARHLAWQAITRFALGTSESAEMATAAAFVGQAYKRLTLSAHHLHGGAGYVVEHRLHHYAERAQALCIRHTPEAAALASVSAALLD